MSFESTVTKMAIMQNFKVMDSVFSMFLTPELLMESTNKQW